MRFDDKLSESFVERHIDQRDDRVKKGQDPGKRPAGPQDEKRIEDACAYPTKGRQEYVGEETNFDERRAVKEG
jgi:hypothetical protein